MTRELSRKKRLDVVLCDQVTDGRFDVNTSGREH